MHTGTAELTTTRNSDGPAVVAVHIAAANRCREWRTEIETADRGFDECKAASVVQAGRVSRAELRTAVATLTSAVYHASPTVSLLGVIVERMGSLPRGAVDLGAWARHVVELLGSDDDRDDPEGVVEYYGLAGYSATAVHLGMTGILATERWIPAPAAVLEACRAARLALVSDLRAARYLDRLAERLDPTPATWDLE